jgi:hypothetical protein
MRTKAVFSRTPVSREACFSILSSMLSVVLMHMNMAYGDAYVKQPTSRMTGNG